jgi:hypothetical protein
MASAKRVLAMSTLAEFYYIGYGTEKNLAKSIKYFRKASRYKFSYAQYRAGLFYLTEENFLDRDEGIKYLKKAARNGNSESSFILGVIYGTGKFGIRDVGQSDKWLLKALKNQHDLAQKYATYLYKSGQVDETNYTEVNKFIRLLTDDLIESNKVNQDINWPQHTGLEVITVSSPSLDEAFDFALNILKTAEPGTNSTTGTNILARRCDQMLSCTFITGDDLWNL